MSMMQLDFHPAPKTLRQFGWISWVMLTGIGLLLRWRLGLPWAGVIGLCAAGSAVFAGSRISTGLVRPVYIALMVISFPIGWAVSHLVMILFFFGIITPLALVFRLLGRDVLHCGRDPQAASYWVRCPRPDSIKRYFKQF